MDNRSFLGLVGYYQRYVPNYYQVASTLTDALRKGEPINVLWDTTREDAIQGLKKVYFSTSAACTGLQQGVCGAVRR